VLSTPTTAQRLQNGSTFVLAAAALVAMLYFGRVFCITIVISIILAFILEPFVTLFMRARLPRPVASFLVCFFALSLVYLMGLGVYTEFEGLSEDLPMYSEKANQLVDSVADRLDKMEQNIYRLMIPKRLQDQEKDKAAQVQATRQNDKKNRRKLPEPVVPPAVQEVRIQQPRTSLIRIGYSYVSAYYNVFLMISFVPFLVYFMLSWRDHIRKRFLSLFEDSDKVIAGKSWHSVAEMARAYVFGNFLLGILLSVASCLSFWSWHLPYWPIVGPVSGFLSLVPYVGLPLAIVPPLLAALTVYATVSPYLFIAATVAFFHLLALNLLYPKLVGARVHLNPLAVTVALMFWGTLWGGIGLVLAVPITAGAKAVFDNVETLAPYGKLLGD
jgi:predicted PurR-regulated permease PerM